MKREALLVRAVLLSPVLLALSLNVAANPTGGVVAQGQATFNTQGSTLTVTNSPNTVINWQNFSIGAGSTTTFLQQSASSAVLNRVVTQNVSNIAGTLQSNGRVFLVNPNGVLFSASAQVNTAAFTASTSNISDADFLAGNHAWSGSGSFLSIEGPMSGAVTITPQGIDIPGSLNAPGNIMMGTAGDINITGPLPGTPLVAPERLITTTNPVVPLNSVIITTGGNLTVGGGTNVTIGNDIVTTSIGNTSTNGAVTLASQSGTTLTSTGGVVSVTSNTSTGGVVSVTSNTSTGGANPPTSGGTPTSNTSTGGANPSTSGGTPTSNTPAGGPNPSIPSTHSNNPALVTANVSGSFTTGNSAASGMTLARAMTGVGGTSSSTANTNATASVPTRASVPPTVIASSVASARPAAVATISLQKREPLF